MEKYAIIVAGGEGTRFGGALPKQFQDLNGLPVVWWSIKAFHDENPHTKIILVLNGNFIDSWNEIVSRLPENSKYSYQTVAGGNTRTASVTNGLELIPENSNVLVAVHDAARPLVSCGMIRKGWEAALTTGCAVPSIPLTDSIREIDGNSSSAVDRNRFIAVQTPQVFRLEVLKDAYSRSGNIPFSDDASACEAAGYTTTIFKGSPLNIKITHPGDLEYASLLMHKAND